VASHFILILIVQLLVLGTHHDVVLLAVARELRILLLLNLLLIYCIELLILFVFNFSVTMAVFGILVDVVLDTWSRG